MKIVPKVQEELHPPSILLQWIQIDTSSCQLLYYFRSRRPAKTTRLQSARRSPQQHVFEMKLR
eukprot:6486194-Amphidinium_carterae.3